MLFSSQLERDVSERAAMPTVAQVARNALFMGSPDVYLNVRLYIERK
jgi:hypothetical protein